LLIDLMSVGKARGLAIQDEEELYEDGGNEDTGVIEIDDEETQKAVEIVGM
jgi:hypothetical protein